MSMVLSGKSRLATLLLSVLAMAVAMMSCGHDGGRRGVRSAYWWKTTLSLDSMERGFIKAHGINRLYIRYFDVVRDEYGQAVPNATITFDSASALPHGVEAVPTVFVMPECLRTDVRLLAHRIVTRVMQIDSVSGVRGVREMQIDCDWTRSTRTLFASFAREVCAVAHRHGLRVSATIRLHQLSQPAPPVDRGVLMLYNTGDPKDLSCRKPILDCRDVRPYLRSLPSYRLPLSAAYPIFGWRLLTRGGRFVGILHYDGEYPVLPDDSIVVRRPSVYDIMATRAAVAAARGGINDETILFDLNANNLTHYTSSDYEKILSY